MMKLKHLFLLALSLSSATATFAKKSPERVISADVSKVECQLSDNYFKCVGAGRAGEGLRADWQKQLTMLQKDAPFEYIRFHGVLCDEMGIYTKDANGVVRYNFQYLDRLFDFLLSVNIRPFVELSFMPSAMSSGTNTIFWWKANIDIPADYNEWYNLIKAFTEHVTERYGSEEVSKWYFEVWNEPNLVGTFFTGTMQDYFDLYDHAARAVRSVNENYRVGGPATAGNAWIDEFIGHCQDNDVPLDFFTTHHYGVEGVLDQFGERQLRMHQNHDAVWATVNETLEKVNKASTRKPIELHYTEWGSSYTPTDLTHDTYFNAAYLLNTLRFADSDVAAMSYFTFTDIVEESGVGAVPFHGGFGFTTISGIKKPAYFSYEFLAQLGKNEIKSSDAYSWVCKDDKGNIQVLAYDLTISDYENGTIFNNDLFAKEVIPADKGNINIDLSGVEDGLYNMEVYRIGYRHNDPLTIYYDLGAPEVLSPSEEATIQSHNDNRAEIKEVVRVENGRFERALPMRDNDIYLVKLNKIN